MAAYVQTASTFGGTTTIPTVQFGSSVTAGNSVIAFVSWDLATGLVNKVTDNLGNLYVALCPTKAVGVITCQAWGAFGVVGGSCTISATMNASTTSPAVKAIEFSGLSGQVDTFLANGTTGTNANVGPITTTNANDVLLGFERGATPSAAGSGWTLVDTQANNIEYQIVSSTGTYTASWTSVSAGYNAIIIALCAGTPVNPWLSTPNAYAGTSGFNATIGSGFIAGNVLEYEYTQPWTVMCAVKVFAIPAAAAIIFTNVLAGGPGFPGYELWVDASGFLHVRIINNIVTPHYIGVIGTTNICDSNWHFVAASYSGSGTAAGVAIYLDGVVQSMTTESDTLATLSIVASGQSLVIGNQAGRASTFQLDGYIDSFSISNIARSSGYISTHASTSTIPPVDANTVLYYTFDEGGGTIANDTSASGFNAQFFVTQSSSPIVPPGAVTSISVITYPSNGVVNLAPLTNTTLAKAAADVLNPPTTNGTLGTPLTNQGNNAYVLVYGSAAASLATPAVPLQNTWAIMGASAPSSGSNVAFGLAPYGSAQGNAQNGAARPGDQIPAVFDLIYAELSTMLSYSYRL